MKSGGKEWYVMLFIIISISAGLFNAGAAHTINRNTEDRVRNTLGSDIVTRQYWQELDEFGRPITRVVATGVRGERQEGSTVFYREPPFIDFRRLQGVDGVARVLQIDNAGVHTSSVDRHTTLIAFDPYDFGHTAWWRPDMTPHMFNEYLNIMTDQPGSAVLSESLRDQLGLREGDRIWITPHSDAERVELYVLAFVDYWPSFSPFNINADDEVVTNHMIAANLQHIFSRTSPMAYNVWIRKSPGVSDGEIYQQLSDMWTPFLRIESTGALMVAAKNDPMLQGTNGALSLGFIIAMIISGMGFLIFWILSINQRVLQFGVFRAMGMTKRNIFRMLVYEQVLVSGVAVAIGTAIGNLVVAMFLPLFSLLYSGIEQNIPFKVFTAEGDSVRVLVLFGILLLVCLAVLNNIIRRIKIYQVVKLGED
jgi:putative ABC transport system permease protein